MSWWSGSACGRGWRWPNRPALRSIAASWWTQLCKPAFLEFMPPAISRAGPIRIRNENIRVEHWVVAERQGQTAARNMLGAREAFDAVPFFWSQHYDVPINYVGHAEKWDEIAIDGDIAGRDCLLKYKSGGRVLAVASIYRDLDSLKAELAMEQGAMR